MRRRRILWLLLLPLSGCSLDPQPLPPSAIQGTDAGGKQNGGGSDGTFTEGADSGTPMAPGSACDAGWDAVTTCDRESNYADAAADALASPDALVDGGDAEEPRDAPSDCAADVGADR